MSENIPQPKAAEGSKLPPFTIEFAENNGRHQWVRVLWRKFRSRWETANVMVRNIGRGSKARVGARTDLGSLVNSLPAIPGIQLVLDPLKATCTIVDPLEKDDALREQIKEALNRDFTRGMIEVMERTEEKLGIDKFKTLVIELAAILAQKKLRVVSGQFPDAKQIESLPGRELYDPGHKTMGYRGPTYQDEAEEYFNRPVGAGR